MDGETEKVFKGVIAFHKSLVDSSGFVLSPSVLFLEKETIVFLEKYRELLEEVEVFDLEDKAQFSQGGSERSAL